MCSGEAHASGHAEPPRGAWRVPRSGTVSGTGRPAAGQRASSVRRVGSTAAVPSPASDVLCAFIPIYVTSNRKPLVIVIESECKAVSEAAG